jgi:acyl phosphate:glycerol-3-phosphate acyltransferase
MPSRLPAAADCGCRRKSRRIDCVIRCHGSPISPLGWARLCPAPPAYYNSYLASGFYRDRVAPLGYTFSAMLGVFLILCGYILGSVPTGLLVGRAFGVDVLKVGSGNIGMANVLRVAGKWPATLTMLGDMLKGFAPVMLARALVDSRWVVAAVALAAVVGACWSVFLGFKGGKAVATGAGTTIGLALPVGLVLFAFWWLVVLTSRYTSLAAIVLMVVTPLAFLLTGQPLAYVLYTVVGGALILWRHRENAQALLAGTERKFGERVRKKRAR